MPTPDLALGIGSVLYALCKIDGRLHLSELQTIKDLLAREPHGEVALHTFFIRENSAESVEPSLRVRSYADSKPTAPILTPLPPANGTSLYLLTVAGADNVYTPQGGDSGAQHFSRELQQI